MLRDIFRFFIYEEEKEKTKIALVRYLCKLLFFKAQKFGRILTALKSFLRSFRLLHHHAAKEVMLWKWVFYSRSLPLSYMFSDICSGVFGENQL